MQFIKQIPIGKYPKYWGVNKEKTQATKLLSTWAQGESPGLLRNNWDFFYLLLIIMSLRTISKISGLYEENCSCGTHLKFVSSA